MNPQDTPYTDAERNAMRAFLQRTEVRISTMHRIATAFIGGAGLLLLIPIFFRDAIDGILEVMLMNTEVQFPRQDPLLGTILTVLLFIFVGYNLLLSLWIPIYSLFLLLKDIVQFYFSLYAPGFAPSLVHPTFSLTGLAFPYDESVRAKRDIMQYQYQSNHIDFVIPFSEGKREAYFDHIVSETHGDIIPPSRQWARLAHEGIVNEESNKKQIERYNAAMGVARSLDRTLVEEVALAEMLIVRNIIYLRRLVLRYTKALLMFIWTTLISFIMLPFLTESRLPVFLVLGVGYFVWSMMVSRLMRLPMNWIIRHRQEHANEAQIDRQLTVLETEMRFWVRLGRVMAIGTLVLVGVSLWA